MEDKPINKGWDGPYQDVLLILILTPEGDKLFSRGEFALSIVIVPGGEQSSGKHHAERSNIENVKRYGGSPPHSKGRGKNNKNGLWLIQSVYTR